MIAAKRILLAIGLSGFVLSGFSATTCVHSNLHRSVLHYGDRCAHSMQSSKIALMFLSREELPLEELWRRWFEDIDGLVYRGCKPDAAEAPEDCRTHHQHKIPAMTLGGPIASQHLFNVYVAITLLKRQRTSSAACCNSHTLLPVLRRYVHTAEGFDQFQEGSIFQGVISSGLVYLHRCLNVVSFLTPSKSPLTF